MTQSGHCARPSWVTILTFQRTNDSARKADAFGHNPDHIGVQGMAYRRVSGAAADQIRVRHQPSNGASARHRGAAGADFLR
jgi:hypothetical protein